jgi:hypothetical protein
MKKWKNECRAEETVSVMNCGEAMGWQIGRERMGSLGERMVERK